MVLHFSESYLFMAYQGLAALQHVLHLTVFLGRIGWNEDEEIQREERKVFLDEHLNQVVFCCCCCVTIL